MPYSIVILSAAIARIALYGADRSVFHFLNDTHMIGFIYKLSCQPERKDMNFESNTLHVFLFCCNLFSSGKFTAPSTMKGTTCHQKAAVAPWCGWYFLSPIFCEAYKANCFYRLSHGIAARFQEVRPFSNPAAPCGR